MELPLDVLLDVPLAVVVVVFGFPLRTIPAAIASTGMFVKLPFREAVHAHIRRLAAANGVRFESPFAPRSDIAEQGPDGEIPGERIENQLPDGFPLEDFRGGRPRRFHRDAPGVELLLEQKVRGTDPWRQ